MLRAFEHASTGLAVFDVNGNLLHSNRAFCDGLGYSVEELRELDALGLVHPAHREQRDQNLWDLFSGKLPAFVLEVRYLKKDGTELWACDSVSLMREADKQHIVIVSEDISKRKRAEKTLVQNEGLITMGRLSASIAHELNNPLESVTNLLFLISNGSDADEMRSYSHLAEQELARVTRIATQTLRFYRPQAAPAPVDLSEVMESVLALFEGRIRREHVNVIKKYQPAPPLVAYSSELRQVFVNLVGNSLDAMPENGRLHISVRPSRNWSGSHAQGVRVTVCDAGTGIPKAMLEKVFEPFVSTKEQSGTGLGLWISKDIVHRHGGVLHIRSQEHGPRQGTCMSVFLPTALEQADANAA